MVHIGAFGISVGGSAVIDGNSKSINAVVATEGVMHVVSHQRRQQQERRRGGGDQGRVAHGCRRLAGIETDSKVGVDAGGVCDANAYGASPAASDAIEISVTNIKTSETVVVNAVLLHVIAGGFAGTATVAFGQRYLTGGR
ncbi:unnamed protein product [Phytophthora fragariaefolia]|uniref:Unnamed protein product n=1 Tax=Phytophthora fragariaefolia TaxID=1490495 RepID=A0A9W6Y2N2_9STRA|nr:unnamed protein product [Phytophthora fragariaefolia]